MTRAELWGLLADWIEQLRDRFNLRTIDDLLRKVKELQTHSIQGISGNIVNSSKRIASLSSGKNERISSWSSIEQAGMTSELSLSCLARNEPEMKAKKTVIPNSVSKMTHGMLFLVDR